MTKTKPRSKRSKVRRKSSKQKPVNRAKSPQLLTALECGKVGLRVAPMHGTKKMLCTCGDKDCKRPGQHLRTPNGIADATSKPAEIKEFWSKYPKAKIAIATGVAGMIALKVAGEAAQAALSKDLAAQSTVEIRDGSSTIFLWKTLLENIPDGTVKLEKGVTVLGRNKFIIAPNDLDASEGARRFAWGPNQVDIAQAPDWLLGRLRPRLLGIGAVGVSAGSDNVRFRTATVEVTSIVNGGRPGDPAEVKLRARSISETGPRMPPAVRLLDGETPR
jgi:Bifunctional DNA primase/polymerase, N-terminal